MGGHALPHAVSLEVRLLLVGGSGLGAVDAIVEGEGELGLDSWWELALSSSSFSELAS